MEPSTERRSRRSMSESDRHSSGEECGSTPPGSPGLLSDFNLEKSVSNPDLNYLRENIVESPMGVGLGTRLQAKHKDGKEEQLARTLQKVEYLKKDIEGWAQICADAPSNTFVIYANYDRLQTKRKIVAREALLRGAEMRVVREIEGLGTRLDNIRKVAEKRYQRQGTRTLGNPQPSVTQVEDEVFNEGEGLEGRITPPLVGLQGQIEPEIEKTPPPRQRAEEIPTPHTPETGNIESESLTASVERIITSFNSARRAAETGEVTNDREDMIDQIIQSIHEVGSSLQPRISRQESQMDSEGLDQRYKNLEDQLGNHSTQLSNIEMRYISIQAKLESMRTNLTEVEGSISQVQISQGVTLTRLDQLENRVGLIDKNIKSYIAKKLAPIKEQMGKLSPETHSSQVTLQLETSIQSRVKRYCEELGLQDLRKDVSEIKEQHELGERTLETLRDIVVEVRDQVTRNPLSANVSRSAHTSTPCPPDPTQSSRECEVIKSSIERSIRLIRQLTETKLTLGSDVGLIKKCNKEDTGKVNRYVKACGDDLLRYIKYPGADQEFCDEIRSILDKADDWVVHVESIYARSEAHAISDARGDITKIGIFANNAEKTVFEFIEETDLGMLGWGTSKQRASLLCKHLSEEIKSRIADFSDDFAKIREWLIKTYGRADRIIGDILKALAVHQAPAMHDKPERYAYLARISMAVARFDKLAKIPDINISSLNSILYCMNTVFGLIQLLPSQDQDQLRRKMTERNLDWDNPQGAATYALFKEYCETERNIVSAYRGLESKTKSKSKSVFVTSVEREEEYEGSAQIHNAVYTPPAPWYPPGRKFPCPLETHDHEMAECLEWLTMSPNERWNNTKVRRICYCCLRSKAVCNEKRCKFSKEVNELITCQGCVTYAASQGWAPFSILMCRKPQHAKVRANYSDIKKTLDKYLGKISTNINESNLKVSANLAWQVHAAAPVTRRDLVGSSGTQEPVGSSVPCINTSSGERVYPEEKLIKSESAQHAHYLMQILQIGESQILAFFDSGANSHLIRRDVALRENLEKYSDTPTRITVVGGGTVCSEYGSFNFCLGPDQENRFHELRCIGMEDLTSDFRKYDLKDIKNEYNLSLEKASPREPLPEYVGGSKVQLLIGIKNSHLMPVLIKTLDSGVGVYKSPFKDIFGSRIIFAGPHASFTRGNRGIRDEVSHAVFHIYQRKEEIAAGAQIPHLLIGDKRTGAGVHPTPLSRKDFTQLGADPGPEPRLGSSQAHFTGLEAHVCRVKGDQIPIARMRELINQDDPEGLISFRCSSCAACITCRKSPRTNAVSLQESREQEVIERSVSINLKEAIVQVKLPFMMNPVGFLKEKHGADNNFKQAISVYRSQCRKSDKMKAGMRQVHEDLVEKGFMKKLSNMNPEVQRLIKDAEFNHYYPWNIVENEGSISTPMRLVVDPSMTGLNQTLAKGENTMGNMLNILLQCLSEEFAWASDISKLYNQLRLEPSALPFSLFLYHDSLDSEVPPEKWLMVRAWYGVTPTGSQAGYALEQLANLSEKEYPLGRDCIINNRYVDDIPSGAGSEEERENQISQVQQILKKGGFSLKYVVRSGEDPDPKSSTDGISTKLLGYKWETREDILRPGLTELNLNKRIRGAKKPNDTPVTSVQEAEKLLQPISITRRQIISKIAELFDPVGLWEPIKLNLKLKAAKLNGMDWDQPIPEEIQDAWKSKLVEFIDYKTLSARRCGIPSEKISSSKVRLIVLADAAEEAGGAAVYAGRKLKTGEWSCSLVAAKSKMMKYTIPRNELSAILLATELAFLVKKAYGEKVDEIIYVTDSTIALSWCHNSTRKLRAFIFARVESIRRMIQWTSEDDRIPLYHIEGTRNLADLLTKDHDIKVEQVSIGSPWQDGEPWMKLDFKDMPLITYDMLSLDKKSQDEFQGECFAEPFLPESQNISINMSNSGPVSLGPKGARVWKEFIIDPVRLGWRKTIRILNIVLKFKECIIHKTFHGYSVVDCRRCQETESKDPRDNHQKSKDILFKNESKLIAETLSSKQLSRFTENEGILYFRSRILNENPFKFKDLDRIPFFDAKLIRNPLPVVMNDSPLLYSLVISIHCSSTPHAGIESTVREVFKEMFVIGGLREMIRKVKSQCITCRILSRKTVELEMDAHPAARTTIAPPFYCSMVDIAYGFAGRAYKRSRTRIKIYALVFCCILTGATNILALEGIETSDVVQAIERHAGRHGVPSELYVDNGSQLKAIEGAKFKIRDVDARVYDAHGIKVYVSNAKAHEERGRVERKIRSLRESLEKMNIKSSNPLTALQWESVFARISSTLDDMPLAKGNTSTASNLGYEIITANRLKLGRNNNRSLEGAGIEIERTPHLGRMLEKNREIYTLWYSIFMDNIHEMMVKPDKWNITGTQPKLDDIVMFVFNDSGYSKELRTWKLGRVTQIQPRKITVEYVSKVSIQGISTMGSVSRNPRDISILFSTDELFINTPEHFKNLFNQE